MHASRFNITTPSADGGRLLFNSATGALVELDTDTLPVIERLLVDPASAGTDEESVHVQSLVDLGMLVDGDELSELRETRQRARADASSLELVIAPTLACNLSCDYCFEATHTGNMTRETEAALLAWIARKLEGKQRVSVTWMGGEPLLRLAQIERLQAGIAQQAAQRGVEVAPASIITNGYLLSGAAAARLAACGIDRVQVTLDGPAESHDRRRVLHGGGPTWERIVSNLVEASKHLRLTIRVNVDRRNVGAVAELRGELARRELFPFIYYEAVTASAHSCGTASTCTMCAETFAAVQLDLIAVDGAAAHFGLPEDLNGVYCGAEREDFFTIGPDGALYQCATSLGAEADRIGSIHSDTQTEAEMAERTYYRQRDPFVDPECRECSLLASCLGGCPYQARQSGGHRCPPLRYNLEEKLRMRATHGASTPAREEDP